MDDKINGMCSCFMKSRPAYQATLIADGYPAWEEFQVAHPDDAALIHDEATNLVLLVFETVGVIHSD